MASVQQTDRPTAAAAPGYESDGGDTQRSADETQYESDGGESERSQKTYEEAVLKIIQESLNRVVPGGSILAEVRRRMGEERGPLRSIMRRMRRSAPRRASAAEREPEHLATEAERWRPRDVWGSVRKRAAAGARHPGRARNALARMPGGIRRKVRYTLTGAEDVRVRDHVREKVRVAKAKMEEPPAIRTRDKFSFMLGVVGCFVIEFVVVQFPQHFGYVFSAFCVPLIALRLWIYADLSWHFFLLDFCYFSNALCVLQVLFFPTSRTLLLVNFCHTTGPLALAIPTWRNSLVFHSLDKVTSVFIHALPPLLCFTLRWYPAPGVEPPEHLDFAPAMGNALLGYAVWQFLQLFITEVVFGRRIRDDAAVMTSQRWLTTADEQGRYSGITLLTYNACRGLGVLRPGELFHSEAWKTKIIFVTVQLIYTCATLLPATLLWSSFPAHLAYLLAIYTFCVWNGGSYYIEVFSRKCAQHRGSPPGPSFNPPRATSRPFVSLVDARATAQSCALMGLTPRPPTVRQTASSSRAIWPRGVPLPSSPSVRRRARRNRRPARRTPMLTRRHPAPTPPNHRRHRRSQRRKPEHASSCVTASRLPSTIRSLRPVP